MDRTLELILYVAQHSEKKTVYWVLKSIYYADRFHTLKYGRRLHDDEYIAMEDGPVGSYAYDLFKNVKFGESRKFVRGYEVAKGQFSVDGDEISPLRDYDATALSESELECLAEAITLTNKMSFKQLADYSHDPAWQVAPSNRPMSIESIISAMEGGEEALPYLKERMAV